jgi:hypothetical protein
MKASSAQPPYSTLTSESTAAMGRMFVGSKWVLHFYGDRARRREDDLHARGGQALVLEHARCVVVAFEQEIAGIRASERSA